MCFFTVLVSLVSREMGEIPQQVIRGISIGMFLVVAPFSSAWMGELDSKSTGFCFRLGYVRPVSTRHLVLIPLLFNVVTAMACYLIPAVFASLLLNTSLPLLGPAVLVALGVQLSVAVVWSCTTRLSKFVGLVTLVSLIVGLGGYLVMRKENAVPILFAISDPSFFEMSWQQYVLLFATMIATTIATIIAVNRQRHGDEWGFLKTALRFAVKRSLASADSANADFRLFRNRLTAQCWFEWRQSGLKMLAAGAISAFITAGLLVACNALYPNRDPNTVVWGIALVFSPFLLLVIGIESAAGLRHVQGTTKLSAFDATRSFTNDQVILIKLVVIALCAAIIWLGMLAIAWIDLVWLGRADKWQNNHIVPAFVAEKVPKITAQLGVSGWIIGCFNLFFLFLSSGSGLLAFSLWMAIYPKRLIAIAIFMALQGLVAVLATIKKWPMETALTVYGYILAVLIVGLCIFSIRRSLQLGAMRKDYLAAVCCLWVISIVPVIVFFCKVAPKLPFAIPTVGIVFAAALLLVPLASTVIAPLAYSTHRHG